MTNMMDNWYTLFTMSTFRDNALWNWFKNLFSLYCHVTLQNKHLYITRNIYYQPSINQNKKDSKNDHDHDFENINYNIDVDHDDQFELNPSFKTRILYKLYHLDFDEIRRSEVLIELLLLSCPIIFTGILSYSTYFTHILKWKRKQFYNSVNISPNTVLTNNDINPTRIDIQVAVILETKINDIVPNEKRNKFNNKCSKQNN